MNEASVTYQLTISGKVQGVWYRASAKDKGLSLGLKGKIWNEKNGDVGAMVQGDVEKVNEFVKWCRIGPPLARVDEVKVDEADDESLYEDFTITRAPE